jgi:hypothetical protein
MYGCKIGENGTLELLVKGTEVEKSERDLRYAEANRGNQIAAGNRDRELAAEKKRDREIKKLDKQGTRVKFDEDAERTRIKRTDGHDTGWDWEPHGNPRGSRPTEKDSKDLEYHTPSKKSLSLDEAKDILKSRVPRGSLGNGGTQTVESDGGTVPYVPAKDTFPNVPDARPGAQLRARLHSKKKEDEATRKRLHAEDMG